MSKEPDFKKEAAKRFATWLAPHVKGKKLTDLAARTRIAYSHIRNIVTGERAPGRRAIADILSALGISEEAAAEAWEAAGCLPLPLVREVSPPRRFIPPVMEFPSGENAAVCLWHALSPNSVAGGGWVLQLKATFKADDEETPLPFEVMWLLGSEQQGVQNAPVGQASILLPQGIYDIGVSFKKKKLGTLWLRQLQVGPAEAGAGR